MLANCLSLELDEADDTNTTYIGLKFILWGILIMFSDILIIGIGRISIHKLLASFPMKILIKGTDCINGTLMERSLMPWKVNYTRLLQIFSSKEGYEKR